MVPFVPLESFPASFSKICLNKVVRLDWLMVFNILCYRKTEIHRNCNCTILMYRFSFEAAGCAGEPVRLVGGGGGAEVPGARSVPRRPVRQLLPLQHHRQRQAGVHGRNQLGLLDSRGPVLTNKEMYHVSTQHAPHATLTYLSQNWLWACVEWF
jgi:hypothetical protein